MNALDGSGTELVIAAEELSPQALAEHAPRYAALKAAITDCRDVDELADCGDRAVAAMAYYRQSRDTSNEVECSRIRLWAERRLGDILIEMVESGRRGRAGRPAENGSAARLFDLGIPKDRASRAQRLSLVPEAQFKAMLAVDEVAQPRRILKRWRDIEQRDSPPDKQQPEPPTVLLLKLIRQVNTAIEQERVPTLKHWRQGIGEDGLDFMRIALPAITRYFSTIERRLQPRRARKRRRQRKPLVRLPHAAKNVETETTP